jgi:hypothetical protein
MRSIQRKKESRHAPGNEMTNLQDLISSDPYFGISVGKAKDIPAPVTEDLLDEEVGKVPKEYRQEFNRLKRLARLVGVEKVVVTPSAPDLDAVYIYSGWEVDSFYARAWGLTKEEIESLNRKKGGAILIWYGADPFARHLAHEIGHHLYRLAEFTEEEESEPVTETMKGLFPNDEYVHQSRDEMCAECFSEYLTETPLRKAVERHCESILRRISRHDPAVVEHVRARRFSNSLNGSLE